MTFVTISNQKGGVGKTTTAANLGVLLARRDRRVLVIDADPQFALTRQLGVQERALVVNLVDVLAGRAAAADAIVRDVYGADVIAAAPPLAGVEMSLVGELGRERFLREALAPVFGEYDDVVIDTPPNLGLLTVNALVVAELVVAPVSGEDDASLHGIRELRQTLRRLAQRLGSPAPDLVAVLTRWHRTGSAAARSSWRSCATASRRKCGSPLAQRCSPVRRRARFRSRSAIRTAHQPSSIASWPSS
jgi:chromosome partitioning protein